MFFAFTKGLSLVLAVLTLTCLLYQAANTKAGQLNLRKEGAGDKHISAGKTIVWTLSFLCRRDVEERLTTPRIWDESRSRNLQFWKLGEKCNRETWTPVKINHKIKTMSSKNLNSGPDTLMFVDVLCKWAFWHSLLKRRIGQTSFRNLSKTGPSKVGKEKAGSTQSIRSHSAEGALQKPVHGSA